MRDNLLQCVIYTDFDAFDLSWKCSKLNRLNCQVQVTVVQLANTEWFFPLPLYTAEIEVKDPNFFIETSLSPFKHHILTFEFKAWRKNCKHDPPLVGGGNKRFFVELRLYNLCKYTREKEMLPNSNWGEIWSHVLIRALQTLQVGPKELEESWLFQKVKTSFHTGLLHKSYNFQIVTHPV